MNITPNMAPPGFFDMILMESRTQKINGVIARRIEYRKHNETGQVLVCVFTIPQDKRGNQ